MLVSEFSAINKEEKSLETYTALIHCINLKARVEVDTATAGATMLPAEPPFTCTAHAMMPKTVPTVPKNAGHMNFSSLCGFIQITTGRYRMIYKKNPTRLFVVVPALESC